MCGSRSPQCCLWLDRSDDARRAPQTGEVGWVQGFKGVGQVFDLFKVGLFQAKPSVWVGWLKVQICWVLFGIKGSRTGSWENIG